MNETKGKKGIVKAVCISEKRGTEKINVEKAEFIPNYGIKNDAHAGNWHRQVSLLSADKIEQFRKEGANVEYGAFGENLVVEGIDFRNLPVGSHLRCKEVLFEITQIGKECHTHCQIYQKMGKCIMPIEGVFARVLEAGEISVGDEMELLPYPQNTPYRAVVITLSDRSASNEREDKSGPLLASLLREAGYRVEEEILLPDGINPLKKELIRLCDQRQIHLILTTGGTGCSPRDLTPEATMQVSERVVPGIAEVMRAYSMQYTNRAMLSRGVAVIRKQSLIINLPGSPKAVKENWECIKEVLPHAIGTLCSKEEE